MATRNPNELVLVNVDTGQITNRVPLPGFARHLKLADAGGPVLVPVESANALVRVELPGGRALPQALLDAAMFTAQNPQLAAKSFQPYAPKTATR